VTEDSVSEDDGSNATGRNTENGEKETDLASMVIAGGIQKMLRKKWIQCQLMLQMWPSLL